MCRLLACRGFNRMGAGRHALVFAGFILVTCSLLRAVFAEEAPAAIRIVSVYRIDLGDFNLGDFRFTTLLKGAEYQMRGEGHFSLLGGLIYNWRGVTASSGKLSNLGPEPAAYALSYVGGGESAQLRMSFDSGAVTQVSMLPKRQPKPRAIPITKEQLAGVLDPLAAVFLRARSDNPDGDSKVCDQTIPVFDGDWRFDLALSPKRKVKLRKQTPVGYSGFAVICGVKFIPIAGYSSDDPDIKLMSQSNEIEVWLVSLPGTAMYAPYRIVLPTAAGPISATSTSFQVQKR
jgi:uncharacterized protein DUF3108